MKNLPQNRCKCFVPPPHYTDYQSHFIGTDDTNGRFAEVTHETCIHCGTIWLNYFVEFESFRKSGRYYRGIISAGELQTITPSNAVQYLESLDWFLYGGSYFDSWGTYGSGKLQVDR
ncbi:hypothetical protein SAMN05421780_101213 [Flexibacter flexilis DSM 6793]|uniref:Uncharacterized protein n=1 Tax=Flexibacter flexilis DSM 6793 TaxID=927664 RepID=A0A1I1DND2_9BACT|nr:hypothetical protein [Flexibacter flexilis]SFB74180.1 hypothetical protein SAMN05421780_101213 [Flexibacter flexilis DSM 6793]